VALSDGEILARLVTRREVAHWGGVRARRGPRAARHL
jgi:hypothetical protein